jgi:hypothetical protein
MASTGATVPTFRGLPSELRNQIYGLVAASTTEKRTILGHKLAQAAKAFDHDGDVREQALAAAVQHPLSMTCRQIRAEFQSGFHDVYTRSQSQRVDLVINNFDIEQMKVFEELRHAKRTQYHSLAKSPRQLRRDTELAWLSKVTIKPRFQIDQDVVASATALQNVIKSGKSRRQSYHIVNDRNDFVVLGDYAVIFRYRDLWTSVVNEAKTMTIVQAKKALKLLENSRTRGNRLESMVYQLIGRFTGLLDGHMYSESRRKERPELLALKLEIFRGGALSL